MFLRTRHERNSIVLLVPPWNSLDSINSGDVVVPGADFKATINFSFDKNWPRSIRESGIASSFFFSRFCWKDAGRAKLFDSATVHVRLGCAAIFHAFSATVWLLWRVISLKIPPPPGVISLTPFGEFIKKRRSWSETYSWLSGRATCPEI